MHIYDLGSPLFSIFDNLDDKNKKTFAVVSKTWNRITQAPDHVLASPTFKAIFAMSPKVILENYNVFKRNQMGPVTTFASLGPKDIIEEAFCYLKCAENGHISLESAEEIIADYVYMNKKSSFNIYYDLAVIALKIDNLQAAKKYVKIIVNPFNELPYPDYPDCPSNRMSAKKLKLASDELSLIIINRYLSNSNCIEASGMLASLQEGADVYTKGLFLIAKTAMELGRIDELIAILNWDQINAFRRRFPNESAIRAWVSCVRGVAFELQNKFGSEVAEKIYNKFPDAFKDQYQEYESDYLNIIQPSDKI